VKTVTRVFIYSLFLCLSYIGSTAAGSLPSGVTKLDAAGVKKYIIGNTVGGTGTDGKAYKEYYAADGTIHGLWNHGTNYSGTWTILASDGRMCFKYKDPSSNGCWFAAVSQSASQSPTQVYWLKSDGSVDGEPTSLKQGDPYGL
jgi:hypothetical protein